MASYKIVYNAGTSPVEVDESGRMAHPGDWTVVDDGDNPVLAAALARSGLVDRTEAIGEKSVPEAWAAKQAAEQRLKQAKPTTPKKAATADTMSVEAASPGTSSK